MAKIQYMTKRCSHTPGPQETKLHIGKIENNVRSKIFHKGKMNLQGLIILSQHYSMPANRIRLVLNMYN